MDITNILQQLRAERDKISAAIASLQAISGGPGAPKRRGRPPKNSLLIDPATASEGSAPVEKQSRGKRTKAQREAQAERMRKYWADRKAQS